MSLYCELADAPVMLAEDDMTTRGWAPVLLNRYIFACIAPPLPRQELEQVWNQLRISGRRSCLCRARLSVL